MSKADPPGATCLGDGRTLFNVWAPLAETVDLDIVGSGRERLRLSRDEWGYHSGNVRNAPPGTLYTYVLNGEISRPDPVSRSQPQGVHGPSEVTSTAFDWTDDDWTGLPMRDYIVYELHVGTFTPQGTFDGVASRLEYLRALGVTAVELMPVAQFPGGRNWGYDGVYPFAVQDTYGGASGLKRLVNACHEAGLAVILDVVYNHMGPEGNYLRDFGHYFTERYKTPWGAAMNFDGPHSDEVRRFFTDNAIHWLADFHIDALRLDAVHAILDHSATHFLKQLASAVAASGALKGRHVHLIAESDQNDRRLVTSPDSGGYGLDGQWSDDFHHSVHTLLTGERRGYYRDFGTVAHLAKAIREGFVYSGEYSPFHKRSHGSSSADLPPEKLTVCSQNHDQIGNRMLGERLSHLVSFEKLKLAAGVTLLSPGVPLLFMGEEYGETAPFQYFVSHGSDELIEAVRKGRAREFAAFSWQEETPDPQSEATFHACKLDHSRRTRGHHRALYEFYRELIRLRKSEKLLAQPDKERTEVASDEENRILTQRRWDSAFEIFIACNFSDNEQSVHVSGIRRNWRGLIDSADAMWSGPGTTALSPRASGSRVTLTLAPHSLVALISET